MAREQRKNVDYFPHECNHGRKMHIIEDRYGNNGYATWFKLLEQLGKANNHYIDISDEMTQMFLSSIFKIETELMMQILNDLAKLKAIDKFLYEEHNVIYSKKFAESIQDAYRNRKGKMFQYSDILDEIRLKKDQSYVRLTPNEANLTLVIHKEEKSIVRKRKEKDILKPEKFNYKKELLKLVPNEILVNDFLELKKIKKAVLSETTFNSLRSECEDNNYPLEEALKIALDRSWAGFKYSWVENLNKTNQITNGNSKIDKPVAGRQTANTIERNSVGWG